MTVGPGTPPSRALMPASTASPPSALVRRSHPVVVSLIAPTASPSFYQPPAPLCHAISGGESDHAPFRRRRVRRARHLHSAPPILAGRRSDVRSREQRRRRRGGMAAADRARIRPPRAARRGLRHRPLRGRLAARGANRGVRRAAERHPGTYGAGARGGRRGRDRADGRSLGRGRERHGFGWRRERGSVAHHRARGRRQRRAVRAVDPRACVARRARPVERGTQVRRDLGDARHVTRRVAPGPPLALRLDRRRDDARRTAGPAGPIVGATAFPGASALWPAGRDVGRGTLALVDRTGRDVDVLAWPALGRGRRPPSPVETPTCSAAASAHDTGDNASDFWRLRSVPGTANVCEYDPFYGGQPTRAKKTCEVPASSPTQASP